ncbi:MAG: GFA family protein [Parvibaculaceae bacterium]
MTGPVLTGGCQCGAVRYRVDGPLGRAGICHCRMCQKAFGGWGAALVSVPEAQLTWTRGRPAEFRSSAIVARGFCARCGTPLHMKEDGDPTYEIAIGTLDDPETAAPIEQAGVEAELSWFKSMSGLPRQATEDYRTPEDMARLRSLQHPDHDTTDWPPKR